MWIIACMGRKFVAAVVILGWVTLSCFDVVEDLDEIRGEVEVASSSPDKNSTSKQMSSVHLANNIVESANQIDHTGVALISFTFVTFQLDRALTFRQHFQLHKRNRVFLI